MNTDPPYIEQGALYDQLQVTRIPFGGGCTRGNSIDERPCSYRYPSDMGPTSMTNAEIMERPITLAYLATEPAGPSR